ncbi:MAG: lamin tail domain-containing protein, partial [Planctomycetota bacterium]
MRKPLWLILAALVFLSGCDHTSTIPPRLLINEVMARNESFADFEFNGLPLDWVEIYNPNAESLRLQDYTLSDNIERPKKYRFPANLVIEPGGYVVVTLVGGNDLEAVQAAREGQGELNFTFTSLHADFGLNAAADSVFLFADGRRIDRMGIRNLAADASVGRFPDGAASIATSFAPTPGSANNSHGALQPRFTAGGQPQPSLCNSADERVRVRFTVLTDPGIPLPAVTMDFIERPGCDAADQVPLICQELFAAAGANVGQAEVALVEETLCQGSAEPGAGDGDVAPGGCPQETVDGSFGNQAVRVLTYEALLPSSDEAAPAETILWNLTLVDDLGKLEVCRCFSYGGGCVSLVINEYQARNIDTLKFICETCQDNVSVRTPDWIEIYNYGEEPVDISEFGLVGRNAARVNNLATWMFGRDTDGEPDSGYLLLQPGECRLVLADGDGGDVRRVYRRLVPDGEGNLVPDLATKYYSTRFALNPNRRSGADEFALTAAVGGFHVVIDRAVLDFSAYAAAHPEVDLVNDEFFLRDLSAARFPELDFPGAETPQERYAPEALSPGRVTDCPSPPAAFDDLTAATNRSACDKPPRFIDEVAVAPAAGAGQAGGRRCPQVGESAVVFAYVAVDATTSAARLAQEATSFTVELDYQHEEGGSGVLSEVSGPLIRPAEDRAADTP